MTNTANATPHVLVVEDDVLIQMLLDAVFEDAGFRVTTASSGPEAMTKIEKAQVSFDALVTDIRLGPTVSGWDVAWKAREFSPTIPVIYITGDSELAWQENGVPESYLYPKPFKTDELVAKTWDLLQH